MSLIGSIVGGFLALMPRVKHPLDALDAERRATKLAREVEALARSRAQLIDHIELLERELATTRHMADHWLGELQRLIRERPLQAYPQQVELNRAMAQQNLAQAYAQHQLGQMQNFAQAQNQQAAYAGRCNCVPSRAQAWAAHQAGLVDRLNRQA